MVEIKIAESDSCTDIRRTKQPASCLQMKLSDSQPQPVHQVWKWNRSASFFFPWVTDLYVGPFRKSDFCCQLLQSIIHIFFHTLLRLLSLLLSNTQENIFPWHLWRFFLRGTLFLSFIFNPLTLPVSTFFSSTLPLSFLESFAWKFWKKATALLAFRPSFFPPPPRRLISWRPRPPSVPASHLFCHVE